MREIINKRFDFIEQSEIRSMSVECEKLGGINLSQGVCDLSIPAVVADGAIRAISDGYNQYSHHDGIRELKRAVCRKAKNFNKIDCKDDNVVITNGATGAFLCTCLALFEAGSEIILFEPFYGYHVQTIMAAKCIPKFVSLKLPDLNFEPGEIENVITSKTKAILINTPNNPSGKVFSLDEINVIAEVAIKHDLLIITDEIYEYFVYDGRSHISPASLSKIADRTITISGYSKVFSITGWRIGYCIAPRSIAQRIGFLSDLIYVCAPTPLQYGVVQGINKLSPDFYDQLRDNYLAKRNKICSALSEIGLKCLIPAGAYYILIDSSLLPGATDKEKAMNLLVAKKVATVPGSAFFQEGESNYLRLCFAKNDDILDKAILNFKK